MERGRARGGGGRGGGKTENPSLCSLLPGRSEGLVSTWDPKSSTKVAGPQLGMREGGPQHTRVGVPNEGGYCARCGGHLAWLHPRPDPVGTRVWRVVRGGPAAPVVAGGWVPTPPRARGPRFLLQVRAQRGVTLPARRGSS